MNSPTLDDKTRSGHVLIKTFELIQHWNIVSKKAKVLCKCFGSRTKVGSWCIFFCQAELRVETFLYGINVYYIQQKGELIPNFHTFQPFVYFQNQNIRFSMFYQIFCFFLDW